MARYSRSRGPDISLTARAISFITKIRKMRSSRDTAAYKIFTLDFTRSRIRSSCSTSQTGTSSPCSTSITTSFTLPSRSTSTNQRFCSTSQANTWSRTLLAKAASPRCTWLRISRHNSCMLPRLSPNSTRTKPPQET